MPLLTCSRMSDVLSISDAEAYERHSAGGLILIP